MIKQHSTAISDDLKKRELHMIEHHPEKVATYSIYADSLCVPLGKDSETDATITRNGMTTRVVADYYELLHSKLDELGIPPAKATDVVPDSANSYKLEWVAPQTPYVRMDLIAKITKFPDWMSEPLRTALQSLVETRGRISDIYNGSNLGRNSNTGRVEKAQSQGMGPRFVWDELDGKVVNKTLEYWADEAIKAQSYIPDDEVFSAGIDILFYEPNRTRSAVVSAWKGVDLFPEQTGIMEAQRDFSEDSNAGYNYGIRFIADLKRGDDVNLEAAAALAEYRPLDGNIESIVGLGGVVRSTLHVTIDEHDPEPHKTIEFLQTECGKQGTDLRVTIPSNIKGKDFSSQIIRDRLNDTLSSGERLTWVKEFRPELMASYNVMFDEYRVASDAPYNAGDFILVQNGVETTMSGKFIIVEAIWFAANAVPSHLVDGVFLLVVPGNELPEGWVAPTKSPSSEA